ncbi:MAG: hypothetical protein FJ207_07830 [Gemmatimonadetes bacterium]|nr:hypothetical protein [Gemmatimonadota bacterium]
MSTDPKEPVNFRLGRGYKQALERLADEQDKTFGQLVREVVERYVTDQERTAWEREARRSAEVLGDAARDPGSDEARVMSALDANLEEFANEWVWSEDEA